MIYVSMEGVDPFSVAASARFEKALLKAKKDGIKVKALLICNPHNPLGNGSFAEYLMVKGIDNDIRAVLPSGSLESIHASVQ